MDNISIIELCNNVKEIAVEAGKAIMVVYGSEDFNVSTKADDSPLTIADKTANDIICAGLENLNATIPIISEENKSIPYEERKAFHYCWMVDPLDGTKEFIKRNGEFTVNIALLRNGNPVMGVVYTPVTESLYYGIEGEGAWKMSGGTERKLRVSQFTMQDPGLRVVCSRSHLNEGTQKYIDALLMPEKVSKGSSLKFLILAEGGAELYPRLAPTMEWDTAAADIILREAGGKVLNAETDKPLMYNKENLLNPHFYASGNASD